MSDSTMRPSFQDRYAARALAACTPITSTPGFTPFAEMQTPHAPLPPPTGTMMVSTSGRSSIISRPYVPTPAMSAGSLAEWM